MKRKRIKTKFGIYLPGEVQIGGVVWTIEDRPLRGERTFASHNSAKLTITFDVAKHATLYELLQTWEHEVNGHSVVCETGYTRPHEELNVEAHLRTQTLVALVMAQ
jgi:hypothetical protein